MIASDGSTPAVAHHAAVQAIPFRPETQSLAGDAWSVLGVLVILLAALVALAVLAKRMGWLERWIVRSPASSGTIVGLHIESTLRISARTTVYALGDAHGRYLLVQSLFKLVVADLFQDVGKTGLVDLEGLSAVWAFYFVHLLSPCVMAFTL